MFSHIVHICSENLVLNEKRIFKALKLCLSSGSGNFIHLRSSLLQKEWIEHEAFT